MSDKEEVSFEELRGLALAQNVDDNKITIGVWAKLNGYSKKRIQRDNKVSTVYIKISNDKFNTDNNYENV
mgnify:CR=1 FL=1|jgi:hypothetical protein